MKRGSKVMAILSNLANGALLTMEILDEMWPVGFTRSYYTNKYRRNKISKMDFETNARQEFYNLLNYLMREGFIEKGKSENGTLWKITKNGLNKLNIFQTKAFYQAETDDNVKIIIFDVPEKERRFRAWLREALKMLGFRMLQKSVWIGKKKIPQQFLFDLRAKRLLPYIHIMEISKGGTLKEII